MTVVGGYGQSVDVDIAIALHLDGRQLSVVRDAVDINVMAAGCQNSRKVAESDLLAADVRRI